MGKVECGELPGIQMWFNSNDHLPPHFHAERAGSWEVRVYFLLPAEEMIELRWGRVPTTRDVARLTAFSEVKRLELLEEFERKVLVR